MPSQRSAGPQSLARNRSQPSVATPPTSQVRRRNSISSPTESRKDLARDLSVVAEREEKEQDLTTPPGSPVLGGGDLPATQSQSSSQEASQSQSQEGRPPSRRPLQRRGLGGLGRTQTLERL
jgi:hypothetical protein